MNDQWRSGGLAAQFRKRALLATSILEIIPIDERIPFSLRMLGISIWATARACGMAVAMAAAAW